MDDVKRIAEESAARPKASPVGAGFESERQREKNALVRQLDAQDGRNVHKIAAASAAPEEDKVLRVAAYCRVSTDDIDQKLYPFADPAVHEENQREPELEICRLLCRRRVFRHQHGAQAGLPEAHEGRDGWKNRHDLLYFKCH